MNQHQAQKSQLFVERLAKAQTKQRANEALRFLATHQKEIIDARKRGVTLKEISSLAKESGTKVSVFVLRQFLKTTEKTKSPVPTKATKQTTSKPGFRVARDEDL